MLMFTPRIDTDYFSVNKFQQEARAAARLCARALQRERPALRADENCVFLVRGQQTGDSCQSSGLSRRLVSIEGRSAITRR
jgi:hypothetical protein